MTYADWLLAAALLSTPLSGDLQDPGGLKDQFPALRIPLTALALEWEILDPRETRYVLTRAEDMLSDLQMLRRRYQELDGAPPLADANRFPDRTVVNELLVFNRSYRKYLEERQPIEQAHSSDLRTVLQEVDHLYQVWDAVRDARCEYYYVTVRRQALKRLHDLMDEDDYTLGVLPPHVPLWRFQQVP